jgi:hypothetical protein
MKKLLFAALVIAALMVVGCKSPVIDGDLIAPTVISTSPADLAVDAAVAGNVTATFSEEVNAATIIAANFTLYQGLTPVAGVVSYANNVATFNPTADLAFSTVYTATVTTSVTDVAGNALAAAKVWSFTTAAAVDVTAPTVASTSPADLAVNVAVAGNVTATFSEAMNAATMIAANFTLYQAATPIAGAVSYASGVATFNPTADLAYNTVYTATVTTSATDVAGNPLAASKIWSFTTATAPDVTAPTVTATGPVNSAVNVAIAGNVTATFSEAMNAATIIGANFTLYQGLTPVAGAVSYASNVATFNPTSNLAYSTVYTATVTTSVTDVAGNPLATNKVWSFTTVTAPDLTPPTVSSTSPADSAIDVAIAANVTATFSEAMNSSTISATNFTLYQAATPIAGAVSYSGNVATFNPTSDLANNAVYTATVTTGATDLAGNPLAASKIWSFTTVAAAPTGPPVVSLGTAGNFVILAKTAISTVPTSAVTGDIAVSPAAASFITGFSLVADATNVFSTATQITGRAYAADYADPTPTNLTTAVSNMEAAYTDAAGRVTPDFLDLGTGEIGGQTLVPGLYKWNTTVTIGTNVTLNGGASAVWIFQISGGITQAAGTNVYLTGGALPQNVFWQAANDVVLGTTAHMEGIVLCQTAIHLGTGASVHGRLLAQTAVTIDGSTVVQPTM